MLLLLEPFSSKKILQFNLQTTITQFKETFKSIPAFLLLFINRYLNIKAFYKKNI